MEEQGAEREQPPPKVEVSPSETEGSQRCPYCHDALSAAKVRDCEVCGTSHHADCLRDGCAVFGCDGSPKTLPPLTPTRLAIWFGVLFACVPMGSLIGGAIAGEEGSVLLAQLIGGVTGAVIATVALLRVDRANAAVRLGMPEQREELRNRTHTEEALDIITLGALGPSAVDQTLAKLAEGAPPKVEAPEGAELPSHCSACGGEIEPPEGKEEPDWFCYHCGEQLQPAE